MAINCLQPENPSKMRDKRYLGGTSSPSNVLSLSLSAIKRLIMLKTSASCEWTLRTKGKLIYMNWSRRGASERWKLIFWLKRGAMKKNFSKHYHAYSSRRSEKKCWTMFIQSLAPTGCGERFLNSLKTLRSHGLINSRIDATLSGEIHRRNPLFPRFSSSDCLTTWQKLPNGKSRRSTMSLIDKWPMHLAWKTRKAAASVLVLEKPEHVKREARRNLL